MSLTCTVIVSAVADKAKRFLAEFYHEGDEGKIFKYGEQLVSSIKISTSSLLMFALIIQIDYQLEPLTSNLKFNSILQCCKIVVYSSSVCLSIVYSLMLQIKLAHREEVELQIDLDDVAEV